MNTEVNKFWGEFLELYESMPYLWKIKSADYSNRELKSICYNKLVEKMKEFDKDANRNKVVKKINIFRTNYKRDLKKMKSSEKSGEEVDEIFQSSLWYFNRLQFLNDQELPRDGKCTMEPDEFDDGTEAGVKAVPNKRKGSDEDNLLKLACQKLARNDNDTSLLAKGWANQYGDLTKEQQIFARTIFSDVLFHGCLGKLTEKSVEDTHKVLNGDMYVTNIQNSSRTSTPIHHDQSGQYVIHSQNFSRTLTPISAEYTIQSGQYSSSSTQHIDESVFTPSVENKQIYFKPILNRATIPNRKYTTQQEVLPTRRMEPTQSIGQYLQDFVDE